MDKMRGRSRWTGCGARKRRLPAGRAESWWHCGIEEEERCTEPRGPGLALSLLAVHHGRGASGVGAQATGLGGLGETAWGLRLEG